MFDLVNSTKNQISLTHLQHQSASFSITVAGGKIPVQSQKNNIIASFNNIFLFSDFEKIFAHQLESTPRRS